MKHRILGAAVALAAVAWVTTAAGPALATELQQPAGSTAVASAPPNIDVAAIQSHLTQLNNFANSNGGTRRAGTAGYTQSVAYIKGKLQAAGYQVAEQRCTSCTFPSNNLIADWPGGDANQTVMFGAHLDSVSAGPGINDNGSGSATLLENALQLAARNPAMTKHVRFAWWTDEEQGLNGSKFYVAQLTAAQRSAIKGYFNFDMLASPNAGYFINNIDTAVSAPLLEYWQSLNLQPEEDVEGHGRSDDAPFSRAGIPSSGYATGASAIKTAAQQRKWGGTANAAYDSCYHSRCDTSSNINTTSLDRAADGIAFTIWKLAVGDTPPQQDDFSVSLTPASGSVAVGNSTTFTVNTATTSGAAQNVALSASGAPAGVTVSFSPASVQSGGSSTATVTVGQSAAGGSYTITVAGSGSVSRTATYALTVTGGGNTPCNGVPEWNATTSYVPNDVVSHGGHKWLSTWYSSGAEPGAPSSWAVWQDQGAC